MKVVGITGGIGSGKTTVCRVFEVLGVPVFYSDYVSEKILFSPEISLVVIKKFGNDIVVNGSLDKKSLGKLVFENKEALNWLNSILHPLVRADFSLWVKRQSSSYVLKEAAILFESGAYKTCDLVINVSCDVEKRIERVVKRDGRSAVEVEGIISKQWSENKRIKHSDFTINNFNQKLLPQIINLHQELL
jgi:dephospho-CoA kinase|tara:strand:+ start:146 stop:715 length:570 start_codon:yes stop_codon:yes gene_type:complete